ncbi:MAG: branched-chain amino acid ABC transporter permease [Syntrophaceae bacterium]|jgi:branched-chain amino acid transport system permease protein|nr:branched-chain amino acid ABC transporter permease [Syntrophaceae bacterium]
MTTFIQLFVSGISVGLIYGLVAVGFVLIYKSSQIFNFAQGEMVMFGAFLMWTFLQPFGLPPLLAIILVLALVGVAGYSLERFPLRPMIGQPILATIMVTMGIGVFLKGLSLLIWSENIGIKFPTVIENRTFTILNIPFSNVTIGSFFFVLILVLLLSIFFNYSRMGLHMRAAAENHQLAQSMGIRVTKAIAQSWAIAAIVSTIGGFTLGYIRGIDFGLTEVGLIAISSALVGGLESFKGAILGGVIMGVAQTLTGGYIGYGLKEVVPFIIMVLVLIYKPYGLFGLVRIERV